jgi:hypothetical protein
MSRELGRPVNGIFNLVDLRGASFRQMFSVVSTCSFPLPASPPSPCS